MFYVDRMGMIMDFQTHCPKCDHLYVCRNGHREKCKCNRKKGSGRKWFDINKETFFEWYVLGVN